MKLQRFFVEEQLRNKKEVTLFDEELIHQLKDVFRLRAGDKIILLDNSGLEYICDVELLAKGKALLKIKYSSEVEDQPKREIWLFASLIKKDNFEWVLQKATELGVAHIVPVLSDRTEKKELNTERAQKIIKEASEQSGRGRMPVLHDIIDFEKLADTPEFSPVEFMAFHMDGHKFDPQTFPPVSSAATALGVSQDSTPLGVLIGPEGGWSENELAFFTEKNIPVYSVGNTVLRAETAAIVIPALLLL
jgi:16S rRNA (uracil1498-N3)-methyltransferase